MIWVTDCCGLYSKPQRRRAYEMSTQLPQPPRLKTLRSHVKRLDWIGHGMKNAVLTTGLLPPVWHSDLRSSRHFRTKTRQGNSGDICTHSINLTTKHKFPTAHLIVGFAKIVWLFFCRLSFLSVISHSGGVPPGQVGSSPQRQCSETNKQTYAYKQFPQFAMLI